MSGHLWRDRAGVAATEAALAISLLLLPLCLGAVAYGAAVADAARLDRALQSAVYYVFSNYSSFTTTSGISSATKTALTSAATAGFGTAAPTPTVTATQTCYCVTNNYTITGTAVACSTTCTGSQTIAAYVTITVNATFTLPIGVATLASPLAQSVSGTIRTQ
jgi:Flp pilus assembly protein TadG